MSDEAATSIEARVADSSRPLLGFDLHSSTGRNFTLRFGSCIGKIKFFSHTCSQILNYLVESTSFEFELAISTAHSSKTRFDMF